MADFHRRVGLWLIFTACQNDRPDGNPITTLEDPITLIDSAVQHLPLRLGEFLNFRRGSLLRYNPVTEPFGFASFFGQDWKFCAWFNEMFRNAARSHPGFPIQSFTSPMLARDDSTDSLLLRPVQQMLLWIRPAKNSGS